MSVTCSHCSLPVPAGLVEDGAELQFCCSGCRVAHEVIRGHVAPHVALHAVSGSREGRLASALRVLTA